MKLFTKFLMAAMLFTASSAFAEETFDGPKTVSFVRITADGDVFVGVDNPGTSVDKCFWSIVGLGNLSTETTKAMYSMVLSARMANQKITLEFTGNDGTQVCPATGVKIQER
ncbi:MAG: hypothetical protein MI867_24215 [Pseudomonadales bacterium]|nr:hypothetical protein [Pseudomonadales bacterium]